MPAKRPSLYLIDGSNNVYRAYFAIRGLTNSSGLATNAVYGFTQMLKKLLKDYNPDCIAVGVVVLEQLLQHLGEAVDGVRGQARRVGQSADGEVGAVDVVGA